MSDVFPRAAILCHYCPYHARGQSWFPLAASPFGPFAVFISPWVIYQLGPVMQSETICQKWWKGDHMREPRGRETSYIRLDGCRLSVSWPNRPGQLSQADEGRPKFLSFITAGGPDPCSSITALSSFVWSSNSWPSCDTEAGGGRCPLIVGVMW